MIFNISGGGGAALNFKVLAYATEAELLAATPMENTIGIVTTIPITSWVFSSTETIPATPGMVWISIGTSSLVEFNALKKNGIRVYPISAKQYVSGAWVDKITKIYQAGAWVSLFDGVLYDAGYENIAVLGANGFLLCSGSGTVTKNANSFVINSNAGDSTAHVSHDNPIDVTNYTQIIAEVHSIYSGTNHYQWLGIADVNTADRFGYIVKTEITAAGDSTVVLDISAVRDMKYISFCAYDQNLTVKKVRLV